MDNSSDPFDISELVELSQEILSIVESVSAAIDPKSVVVGQDRSGAVRATVDCTGGIRSVRLDERWTEKLRPSELGRAVMAANQDGQEKRMAAWAQNGVDQAADVAAHARRADGSAPIDSSSAPLRQHTPETVQRTHEAFSRESEGWAPNHSVRIRAVGPNISDVFVDDRWAARAHYEEIGEQITGAVKNLYQKFPDEVVDFLAIDAVSSEVQELRRQISGLDRAHRESF